MIRKVIVDKDGERYIGICAHCGNNTSQNVLFKHIGSEIAYMPSGEEIDFEVEYRLTKCGTCENVLLYGNPEYLNEELFGALLYPIQSNLSDSIPVEICKVYEEAKSISKLAPNAFVVQIRRALEFLCNDKKIKGRNLNDRVKEMARMGLIPPALATMTDGIRIFGNIGAHASSVEIKPEDVLLVDDFFKAILEYVYVAPNKMDVLKKRLNEMKI